MNEGTCVLRNGGYHCECRGGWEGPHCETRKWGACAAAGSCTQPSPGNSAGARGLLGGGSRAIMSSFKHEMLNGGLLRPQCQAGCGEQRKQDKKQLCPRGASVLVRESVNECSVSCIRWCSAPRRKTMAAGRKASRSGPRLAAQWTQSTWKSGAAGAEAGGWAGGVRAGRSSFWSVCSVTMGGSSGELGWGEK